MTIRNHDLTQEDYNLLSKSTLIYADTETNGLDYRKHQLLQIQLMNHKKDVFIVRKPNFKSEILKELLETFTFVFHHKAFDYKFLAWHLQLDDSIYSHCTKIRSKVLNPDKKSSLKQVVERHTGVILEKGEALSDWSADILTEKQIKYAIGDVAFLPEIFEKQEESLSAEQAALVYLADATIAAQARLDIMGRLDLLDFPDKPEEVLKLTQEWKTQKAKQ